MKTRRLEHTGALALLCDCCGERVVASIQNGNFIIRNDRHGETHTLTLPLAALDKLSKLAIVSNQ